jgi:hypothetical protein
LWRALRNTRLVGRRVRQRQFVQAVRRRIAGKATPSPAGDISAALDRIREGYTARPFSLPATVIVSDEFEQNVLPAWYLKSIVRRPRSWKRLPGLHSGLLLPPTVDEVASEIHAALDEAVASQTSA